jgi:hypothetical protein
MREAAPAASLRARPARAFQVKAGRLPWSAVRNALQGRQRRELRPVPGRDPGRGGRVGLRQVHPGARGAEPGPGHQRQHEVDGPGDGGAGPDAWQQVRKQVQMVFQDPLASLNPRMNIAQIIAEPLRTHEPAAAGAEVLARVKAMLARVGLADAAAVPLSARVLRRPVPAHRHCPRADPASPSSWSATSRCRRSTCRSRRRSSTCCKDLQREMGLALIFIAHDLAVVKHISQRMLVMYLGRRWKLAQKKALYARRASLHPGAAVGRAGARPALERTSHPAAAGRHAFADQPAFQRLRVPHAAARLLA